MQNLLTSVDERLQICFLEAWLAVMIQDCFVMRKGLVHNHKIGRNADKLQARVIVGRRYSNRVFEQRRRCTK